MAVLVKGGGGTTNTSVIVVTTTFETLFGQEVTCSLDGGEYSLTSTFSDDGICLFNVKYVGNYTVSASDGTVSTKETVTITSDDIVNKTVLSCVLSLLKIVTWADGSWEEINAMLEAHYNDEINISDYWAVGDKRSVTLSAMSATGVDESHREQTVEFAIAGFDHDDLSTPINGHTKSAVALTQVDCLMSEGCTTEQNNKELGYMNSTNNTSGGWYSCARRTWCNNVYFNSIPEELRNIIKEVNKLTSAGLGSTTINTTTDKVFLISEIEEFGTTTNTAVGEGEQYPYYEISSNRYKNPKSYHNSIPYESGNYYGRSPVTDANGNTNFLRIDIEGGVNSSPASAKLEIAPNICI
jgi:hypothetical protein